MNLDILKEIKTLSTKGINTVIVTKNQSDDDLKYLIDNNFTLFGENKLQELKRKSLLHPDVKFDFIGRIQSNKIKDIVKYSNMIHSVSDLRILTLISKEATRQEKTKDVLLQVNLANDQNKVGMDADTCINIIKKQNDYPNINILGIMVIGNHCSDVSIIDYTFESGYHLYDQLREISPTINTLSMGMSNDYHIAIDNHANLLRLGSIVFKKD